MANNLRILLIIFSILFFCIVLRLISKKKIQINNSLFWLFSAVLIFLVALFPNFISFFTKLIGFETTSNFVIGIILTLLLLDTLLLTIYLAEQNKKIVLLIQEVSMLKQNVGDKEGKHD